MDMTIDEARALVDDIISHIWDRSIGAQEDVDMEKAVRVLAQAAREHQETRRLVSDELVEAADRALSEIKPGSLMDVWLSRQGQPVSSLVNALMMRRDR